MNNENLTYDISNASEDDEPSEMCEKCGSFDVVYLGGDEVVNIGSRAMFTRVDWWECLKCGHRWTESYDHE